MASAPGAPLDARAVAARAAADRAFCVALLPRVSRTFALSIEALPETLRDAVRVSYLLCRAVDTIEDEPRLAPAVRVALFDAFDALLADDAADPAAFEQACAGANLAAAGPDGELCRGAGALFRAFRALPAAQRDAVRPHVQEMSRGMRAYCARADAAGAELRLTDLPDLERYCYYVAGTVGNLLTALFEETVPGLTPAARAGARERAVSFGLGLQLVNIVKDVAEDLARGVCFLPESLAAAHGVALEQILEPEARAAGLAIVRAVSERAHAHLDRAREYVALWPAGPEGTAVRLFCAVPLGLALATLREVERGKDTLRAGATPKVSRPFVARLLISARMAAGSDQKLARLFARCEGVRPETGPVSDAVA